MFDQFAYFQPTAAGSRVCQGVETVDPWPFTPRLPLVDRYPFPQDVADPRRGRRRGCV